MDSNTQSTQGTIKNKIVALITIAQQSIQNSDEKKLKQILSLIPLEKLQKNTTESLFIRFISISARFNQKWAIDVIFEAWERVYRNDLDLSFMSDLFVRPILPNSLLEFVVSARNTNTLVEIISEFIKSDSNERIKLGCSKAIQIYGEQSKYTYQLLYDISERNSKVREYFKFKLSEVNDFQEKPKWIKGKPLQSEMDLMKSLPPVKEVNEVPSYEDMARILVLKLDNTGMSQVEKDSAMEAATLLFRASTPSERLNLLRSDMETVLRNTSLDNIEKGEKEREIKIFNILGPANPLIDATSEEMIYGGERMFTSYVYDNPNDDDVPPDIKDWYTGSCQQCLKRIQKRWYAVRMPRPPGGWDGCYCSWKCVSDNLKEFKEPDMSIFILMSIFSSQIKEFGILDRTAGVKQLPLTIEKLNDIIGRPFN